MTNSPKDQALEALNQGHELMDCILHDSRVWMSAIGEGVSKNDARTYLLNRIYMALENA